jgi:hypothetical protein
VNPDAFAFFATLALMVLLFAIACVATASISTPRVDATNDREIEEQSRAWDHGSRATEHRPNLEYARRLNRQSMFSHSTTRPQSE